jgi:hypothetical protein
MVTKTETTEIVTCPKTQEIQQPSFKRWLKHLLHMPASKRFFNQQDQHAIAQSVAAAEQGHVGEIQVVIEGHMPAREAYYLDTRGRAKQLFAELGVWDTELNSGILLYLNLCERILFLEGLPNLQHLGKLYIGQHTVEVLNCDVRKVKENIESIQAAVKLAEEQLDYVTRDLVQEILEKEEEWLDWVTTQLDLVETVGVENYIQSQI